MRLKGHSLTTCKRPMGSEKGNILGYLMLWTPFTKYVFLFEQLFCEKWLLRELKKKMEKIKREKNGVNIGPQLLLPVDCLNANACNANSSCQSYHEKKARAWWNSSWFGVHLLVAHIIAWLFLFFWWESIKKSKESKWVKYYQAQLHLSLNNFN